MTSSKTAATVAASIDNRPEQMDSHPLLDPREDLSPRKQELLVRRRLVRLFHTRPARGQLT